LFLLSPNNSSKGYAEYCAAPAITCMKVPESLPMVQAAGVPEAFLTAFQLLHTVGHVQVCFVVGVVPQS